jgi:cytochrome b
VSRQIPLGDAPLSRIGIGQPVWDLSVRLVHWLLAALIGFSWWSAEYGHTDWHIWSGCAILALLIYRFLWGFVGSSTARFASFVRGPRVIARYLRGGWIGLGHNPLGALSVLALFIAVAVQVGLGLVSQDEDGIYTGPLYRLVSSDTSDRARDLHAAWFDVILALIVLHLAAIAIYWLRGRNLVSPMITGRVEPEAGTEPMRPGKWWVALVCVAVGIGITRWVIAGAPPFSS